MSWPKRLAAEIVLALHGIGAVGWWWLTPGGFPSSHSRFWMNRVWPLLIVAIAVVGIVALARKRHLWLKVALLILAALWIGAAISSRIVFPVSLATLWWWVLLIGGVGDVLVLRWEIPGAGWRTAVASASLMGLLAGAFVPWALCGPESSTHPLGGDAAKASSGDVNPKAAAIVSLTKSINVVAAGGLISIQHEPYRLQIEPLLSFEHISPDRCWSILIPPALQRLSPRRVTDVRREGDELHAVQIRYDSRESLSVSSANSQFTEITATRTLSEATYSHLNSFCVLTVTGHRRLFLRFSPCRENRIEVLSADYPTGRPARFAYRTANHFFVVEATSGEKGPFHELASGSLQSRDPINLSLEDEDREIGTVTFDDWSAQASTELSPTAGWGVPQNAIEFQRTGDEPSASAMIWLTLAATSVGRGWDTIGHSSGTYRNRMAVNFPDSKNTAPLKTKE